MAEFLVGSEETIVLEDHTTETQVILHENPSAQVIVASPETVYEILQPIVGSGGGASSWDELTDKPTTFPPEEHDHDDRYIQTVNGTGPDESGNVIVATDVGTVEWDTVQNKPSTFDPSPHTHDDRYYTETETDSLLGGKQDSGDYATNSDLATGLEGKSDTGHTHSADDISDGTTNHVFTAADDTKLAGIATGATANSTNATLLAKANHTGTQAISTIIGLQTSLDGKQASGDYATNTALTTGLGEKADATHNHTASQITDFNAAVDGRIENIIGTAPEALDTLGEIADALADDADFAATITTALSGKADSVHSHTIANVTGLQAELDGKQAAGSYSTTSHTHDDRYYTESEVDSLLINKANTSSLFSGDYSDLTNKPTIPTSASDVGAVPTSRTVNGKALSSNITLSNTDVGAAATSHTHPASQISDSTAVGQSLITASTASAARTAIGAGTSNLAIGTSGSTAKAGNYTPSIADLPAGVTLAVIYNGTSWPSRPTARTDITVLWLDFVGDSPVPSGVDNVDIVIKDSSP